MDIRKPKGIVLIAIIGIVLLAVLVPLGMNLTFYIADVFGRPEPVYQVESIGQLEEEISKADNIITLPGEEMLLGFNGSAEYMVYTENRLDSTPVGYLIKVFASEAEDQWLSVESEPLSRYSVYVLENEKPIQHNKIDIIVTEQGLVWFNMDENQYRINYITDSESDTEKAVQLAKSIIDNR